MWPKCTGSRLIVNLSKYKLWDGDMSHSLAQGEATCDPNNVGHGDKAKVTFSWPCSLLTPVVFENIVLILRDSLLSVLQLFPMHCNVNIVSHLRWTRMTYIYINCLLKANIWVSSVLFYLHDFFPPSPLLWLNNCISHTYMVEAGDPHKYQLFAGSKYLGLLSPLYCQCLPEKYRMKRFARP